ncbi:ER lumen protein retaining receptor [Nematocida displodere]|uniref:ER lumen protein retaining receptor n=1 Tax=Nematocida displodere TaxID=1805483 RepID=A0A177EAS9_9MICR|nr:ER lumen protein retaining receptor [Nematocida displodere]
MSIILSGLELLVRTSGDALHVLSMLVLLLKMRRTSSSSGISLKSQILYVLVFFGRYLDLLWVFIHPHRIFQSNRLIYNTIMKCVFISCQGYIIWVIVKIYPHTYDKDCDELPLWVLIAPALAGGFFLMSWGSSFLKTAINWLWSSSIVLESVSILPQLAMLHKRGEGESLTIHYIIFLGLYRACYMVGWLIKWMNNGGYHSILIWSAAIQTLIYADLFTTYAQAFISKRKKLTTTNPVEFLKEAFGRKK